MNEAIAKSEIYSHFKNRFEYLIANGSPSDGVSELQLKRKGQVGTYVPTVRYHNDERRDTPDVDEHYLRISASDVTSEQSTFTGPQVASTGANHTVRGLIRVQIFYSKVSHLFADEQKMNFFVKRCFVQTSTPGGIWFRNANIVSMPPDETYFRCDVTTEYEYDSVVK